MRATPVPAAVSTATDLDVRSASFDVDESIAAAVLSHVHDLRDRLALACVSRVWRRVSATTESWGASLDVLVVDGTLAGRLNDERFASLMRYCGRLKRLEVHDAPKNFEGNCFSKPHPALDVSKFASLHTLILRGCTGVSAGYVSAFLRRTGVHERPKEERLDCLRLGGCSALPEDLPFLWECLRHNRNRAEPYAEYNLDIWECDCEDCKKISDGVEQYCPACSSIYCTDCRHGEDLDLCYFCDVCDIFACGCAERDDFIESNTMECDSCHITLCTDCLADTSKCDICGETLCGACLFRDDNRNFYWQCDACKQSLCKRCADGKFMNVCTGSDKHDGCLRSLCDPCLKDSKELWTFCGECHSRWCSSCLPEPRICYGSSEAKGCFESLCPTCCDRAKGPWVFCDACSGFWCHACMPNPHFCFGSSKKKGCCKMRCEPCVVMNEESWTFCKACKAFFCESCLPEPAICFGSFVDPEVRGCGESLCPTCAHESKDPWFECDTCEGIWCTSCTSKWPVCVGNSAFEGCNERLCRNCLEVASKSPTACALDCGGVWCPTCKPEMRAVNVLRRNDEGAVEVIESLACPPCAEKTNLAEQKPRNEPKKKPTKKSKKKKKTKKKKKK